MKKMNKVLVSMLAMLLVLSVMAGAASASGLDNGEYTINVKAMHMTENKESAANDTLTNQAKLEVVNGTIYAYITSESSTWRIGGTNGNPGEVVSESGSKKTYKIKVSSLDNPIVVGVHVAQAGIDVEFKVVFDKNSLKKTGEVAATTQSSSNAGSGQVENPKTSDSFSLTGIALAFVLLAMVTVGLHMNKTRKAVN